MGKPIFLFTADEKLHSFRTVRPPNEKRKPPTSSDILLTDAGTATHYAGRKRIYSQGSRSGAMFYVQDGIVILTVESLGKRPAVISVISAGTFFGEACLTGRLSHLSTATTLIPSSVLLIKKSEMVRLLHEHPEINALFQSHLLGANMRFREHLLDVMVNSASQRLARILLRLAGISSTGSPGKASIPRISQLALAEMVGTTRSRINFFMNQFRRSGFISYKGTIQVRKSLRHALTPA
jgi:CRP/FNR family cyclic AMP-dependent transcriptional regulator